MTTNDVKRGDLYFLLHAQDVQFSGYGLVMASGNLRQLVGLLMVDRPQPVSPIWLEQVQASYGQATLYPMTRTGERGLACRMWIAEESLVHVRALRGGFTHAMQEALFPMLTRPPAPQLNVWWDRASARWKSEFRAVDANTTLPGNEVTPSPRFALGQVVATPGALAALEEAGQLPQEFLYRHLAGDWGELDAEDKQSNEWAVENGGRLFSAYTTATGSRLWLITEYDRSVTTLLLPSEY